jgi:hypothetical protein
MRFFTREECRFGTIRWAEQVAVRVFCVYVVLLLAIVPVGAVARVLGRIALDIYHRVTLGPGLHAFGTSYARDVEARFIYYAFLILYAIFLAAAVLAIRAYYRRTERRSPSNPMRPRT